MKQKSFKILATLAFAMISFIMLINVRVDATQTPLDILGEDDVIIDIDVIMDESLGDGFIPSLARTSVGTIRYAGGGHTSGTVPAQHTLSVPGSATLRQPGTLARTGHTFAGWRSSSSGNIFQGGATVVFSNPGTVTYTAVWVNNNNAGTIRYAGGGHTSGTVPASHPAPIGVPTTLRAPGNLARTGHTFGGWRSSSSGNIFHPGQTVTFSTTNTTTYTAVWNPTSGGGGGGTIRYASSGHTSGSVPASHAAPIGVPTALRAPGNLARTGHTFAGWRSSSSGRVFQPGETVTFSTTNTTTYTALWVSNSMSWYSDVDAAHFWPGAVNVYVRTVGTVSAAFNFSERVRQAREAWGNANALGITIGTTTTRANAQIIATGGPRADIEDNRGDDIGTTRWTGITSTPRASDLTRVARMHIGGRNRNIYRISGQMSIWVVQRPDGNVNRTRNTTTHEMGHALGWWGHSNDRQDVMWYTESDNIVLRANERAHLRQIYNRFR